MLEMEKELAAYQPVNEQEAADQAQMLHLLRREKDILCRENRTAHFTASAWVVNPQRNRVLMVYHTLYDSWAWTGGHADGDPDLRRVALREVREETGLAQVRLAVPDIFSLEILTVDGHEKRGAYVPSHLHLNVTFLVEADDRQTLQSKPDENKAVAWFTLPQSETMPTEPWMVARVYRKLNEKLLSLPR